MKEGFYLSPDGNSIIEVSVTSDYDFCLSYLIEDVPMIVNYFGVGEYEFNLLYGSWIYLE